MLRAVVDTNVFISALLKNSSTRPVLTAFQRYEFELIASPEILDEFIGVINRSKFNGLIVKETAQKIIEDIKSHATIVKPSQRLEIVTKDPDDNQFLEAAIEGKASCVVSGDHHLLSIKSFCNIPIITPKEFITWLKKR